MKRNVIGWLTCQSKWPLEIGESCHTDKHRAHRERVCGRCMVNTTNLSLSPDKIAQPSSLNICDVYTESTQRNAYWKHCHLLICSRRQCNVFNLFLIFQARYKQSLDPTVDEVKKLCTSLRRNAKEERVLFHYNGHGVPRPTVNGEIWVFNKVR